MGSPVPVGISHRRQRGKSGVIPALSRSCEEWPPGHSSQNARRFSSPSARTALMFQASARGRALALTVSAGFLCLAALGQAAHAHHVVDITGLEPTVANGLLSGLAHPVIGPDHLLFLLALSLLGLQQRSGWMLLLLAVGLAGSAAGLVLPGLPLAELLVAATLAVVGGVLLGVLPRVLVVPAMALHGYVLSDAVLGWTAMPLVSYLMGLLLSQGLLLLVALQLLRPLAERLSRAGRRWVAMALVGTSLVLALATEMG
jgi:urease accessory protein